MSRGKAVYACVHVVLMPLVLIVGLTFTEYISPLIPCHFADRHCAAGASNSEILIVVPGPHEAPNTGIFLKETFAAMKQSQEEPLPFGRRYAAPSSSSAADAPPTTDGTPPPPLPSPFMCKMC